MWDTCLTPVLKPEDTLNDCHLKMREMITEMDDAQRGKTVQLGFPAKFSEELNFKRTPAPSFGQHTKEILIGLGYPDSSIQSLEKDGVI